MKYNLCFHQLSVYYRSISSAMPMYVVCLILNLNQLKIKLSDINTFTLLPIKSAEYLDFLSNIAHDVIHKP